MIWSQSERCERAREGNGCCVVWRITFYLLPPSAALLLLSGNRPPPWESLGRANELAVQQNAVAASRLPPARQNRMID